MINQSEKMARIASEGYILKHDLNLIGNCEISLYYEMDGVIICKVTGVHNGDRANMQSLADYLLVCATDLAWNIMHNYYENGE